MMEGPSCLIWIHPWWQKRYTSVLTMLFSQLKVQNMHRYIAEYSPGPGLQPGSHYSCKKTRGKNREKYELNERKSERGRKPGCHFSPCQLPTSPILPPSFTPEMWMLRGDNYQLTLHHGPRDRRWRPSSKQMMLGSKLQACLWVCLLPAPQRGPAPH